jgi:hypothetical protein
MFWEPVRDERGDIVRYEPYVGKVRSGRDLMQNDYTQEMVAQTTSVRYGLARLHALVASDTATPEHPNYREQYQRMGEQTT